MSFTCFIDHVSVYELSDVRVGDLSVSVSGPGQGWDEAGVRSGAVACARGYEIIIHNLIWSAK